MLVFIVGFELLMLRYHDGDFGLVLRLVSHGFVLSALVRCWKCLSKVL